MNYYLSDSDVKILKQTVNTVNNLPSSQRNKSRPTIKHAFAYVELTEQNEDGLWSAKEVYFDETGTASELVDGRTWGADSVYIIVNGTVSVGQVVRVEAYYMVDANGAEQAVWVGSAIGGGGGDVLYCVFKNNEGNDLYTCDVYPNALFAQDTEVKLNANVRVFNVDYGSVLNDTKLTCWTAPTSDEGVDYYAEAPTWQQEA